MCGRFLCLIALEKARFIPMLDYFLVRKNVTRIYRIYGKNRRPRIIRTITRSRVRIN